MVLKFPANAYEEGICNGTSVGGVFLKTANGAMVIVPFDNIAKVFIID